MTKISKSLNLVSCDATAAVSVSVSASVLGSLLRANRTQDPPRWRDNRARPASSRGARNLDLVVESFIRERRARKADADRCHLSIPFISNCVCHMPYPPFSPFGAAETFAYRYA